MKIALIKIVAASFVVAMFSLSGCKKADPGPKGDAGPTGPTGSTSSYLTSGGFISGTVSGTRRDGVPFNEQFSYNYHWPGINGTGTLDSIGINQFWFNVERNDRDNSGDNYCSLNITTNSKTASTGTMNISFNFNKLLSPSKYFSFSLSSASSSVTGLSYNSVTGLFTGAFNITTTNNSTNNSATLVGTFQVNVLQRVQRVNQEGVIPKK